MRRVAHQRCQLGASFHETFLPFAIDNSEVRLVSTLASERGKVQISLLVNQHGGLVDWLSNPK